MSYDVIVAGGGHNGLVCAAQLARAGRRVVVVERRERTGGILDGVVSTVGRLRPAVVSELELERHGLELERPNVRMLALRDSAPPLTFWADPARTAEELGAVSPEDGSAYPRFDAHVRVLARFLGELAEVTPPRLDPGATGDWQSGLRLARAYRRLSARSARELTRALPMAAADFVGEWFTSDAVRGPLAARGSLFTAMGPWSAGTALVLLADSAGNDGGAAGQTVFAKGGPTALASALDAATAQPVPRCERVRRSRPCSCAVGGSQGSPLRRERRSRLLSWPAASTRRRCSLGGSSRRRRARGFGGAPGTSARPARRPPSPCASRPLPSSPASTTPSGWVDESSSRRASTTSSGPSTAGSTTR